MEGNYVIQYGQLMEIKEEIKEEPEDFDEGTYENEPDPDEEALQGNFLPGLNSLPTDQISATWDDNDINLPIPEPTDSPPNIQIPATWNDSDINLPIPELTDSLPQTILLSNQSDFYPLNSGFHTLLQPNAHAMEPSQIPATDQIRFCVANNLSQVEVPGIQTVQTENLSSNEHFSEPPANVLDNYEMLLQENENYAVQNYDLQPTNDSEAQNFNPDIMCPAASMNPRNTTDPTRNLQSAAEAGDSNRRKNSWGVKRRRSAPKKRKTTCDPTTDVELAGESNDSNQEENSQGVKRRRSVPKKRKTTYDPPTNTELAPEASASNERENSLEVQFGGPGHIDPNQISDPTRNLQPIAGNSNSDQPINLKEVTIGCPIPLDPKFTVDLAKIIRSEIRAGNFEVPKDFEPVLIRLDNSTDTNPTLNPYRRRLRSATRASQRNFNALLISALTPTKQNFTIDPTKNLQSAAEANNSNRSQNLQEVQRGGPTPSDAKPSSHITRNIQFVAEANNSNETQNLNPIIIRAAAHNPKLTTKIAKILQPVTGVTESEQYFNAFLISSDPTTDQDQTIEPPSNLEPAEGAGNSNRQKNSQGVQRRRPGPKKPTTTADPATNPEPVAGGSKSKRRKNSWGVKRRRSAPKKRKTTCEPPTDLELPQESSDSNQRENSQELQRCDSSASDRQATSEVARNLEPATLAGNSTGPQNLQEVQHVLSSIDRQATSEVARNLEPATLASNSTGPQSSGEVQREGPADKNRNPTSGVNRIPDSLGQINDFDEQIGSLEPMDIRTLRCVARVLHWLGSITNSNEPQHSESQETANSASENFRVQMGLARLVRFIAQNPNQPQNFNLADRATDTISTLNPTSNLRPAAEVCNSNPSQTSEESQRRDPASTDPTSSLQPAVGGNDSNQVQYFTPLKIVVPSCLVSQLTTQIARNLKPAIEAGNAQNSPEAPPGGLLPPQPQLILELSGIQEVSLRAPTSYQPEPEPEPEPESSSLIQFSGSVPPNPKLTFQFRGFLQPIDKEDQPEPRKKLYQLRIHSLTPKFPIPPLMDDEVQFIGTRSRNLEPAWIEPIDDEVQFIGSTSKNPQPAPIGDEVGSCDKESENPEPARIGDEVGSCGTESQNAEPAENCNELLIRPQVPSNLKRARSFNDDQTRPPVAKIPKRADNFRDDHNYCSPAKNPKLAQNSSENPTCSLAPTKPKLTFDFTGLRSLMAGPNQAGCIECTGQFSGKSDDTKRVDEPDSGSTVKCDTSDIQSATTSTGTSSKTCKCKDVFALYASFKPRVYWHCSVPHCPAIFEEESEKDKHEAFHKSFPDNIFQCEDCKSRFPCFRFSKGQISVCKSLEQMKCSQRIYDSPRSLKLKKHIARYISRMDCTECKREYPYIDKLTKHVIDSHHKSVVFQCTKCPSCFVLSEFISRHICVRDIDDPECELSPFIQIKEHWSS